MHGSVHLSDGATLDFDDFDAETFLDLMHDLNEGDQRFLTFDMDGATVIVARAHIVRIDFETGA